jgi:hypothetical protein
MNDRIVLTSMRLPEGLRRRLAMQAKKESEASKRVSATQLAVELLDTGLTVREKVFEKQRSVFERALEKTMEAKHDAV